MKTLFTLIIVSIFIGVQAQSLHQTIRGSVIDKDSKAPIPGVQLAIENSNPIIGTVTDANGFFVFLAIPIGRYSILISSIGYESASVNALQIEAGKEAVITIEITELVTQLDEVRISGRKKQ